MLTRDQEMTQADPPSTTISITREDKPTGGRYVARIAGFPEAEMTFSKAGEKIIIIDPKAHGLGYLYPPADSPSDVDQEIGHVGL